MKKVIFLAFLMFVGNGLAASPKGPSAADVCANNFLNMFYEVSKDTSGKFKKIIFTFDADKEMLKLASELQQVSDQVNGADALEIFKKTKPILLKNAKKEFNLCIDFTTAMNKEMAKICPGIQTFNKECQEAASSAPKVFELLKKSDKAVKELVIAQQKYGPQP